MLVSADWLPLDLYHTIYWPLLWLVDHCPVTPARYCRLIETWWILDWLFGTALWTSNQLRGPFPAAHCRS